MIRSIFHRVFVVLPCRTYRYLGSDGGSVPVGAIVGGALLASVTGGLWALGTWVLGQPGADDFWIGAGVGVGLGMVWIVYTLVIVAVLRVTGSDWSQVLKRQRESS